MNTFSPDGAKRVADRLGDVRSESKSTDRTRLRIVRAATELFIRHGYRKTTVDEIARRCGVAKGTIYLYARSKAELLFQAVAEEKRCSTELFAPVLASEVQPRERLRLFVRTSIALIPLLPLSAQLLSGNHEFLAAFEQLEVDRQADLLESRTEMLRELISAAIKPTVLPSDTLDDRARALRAVIMSLVMADERARGDLPLERYAELVAELVVNGILSPEPTDRSVE